MDRKILFASLLLAMPAILSAQEAKLVNCRTLEAAGFFVGPDEVLDNDMVCQKVKPGAAQAGKPRTPKALPGTVISDSDPMNVTEAAKAAEKRVAAAREAIAAKEAAAIKPETAPESAESTPAQAQEPAAAVPAPSAEPSAAVSTPAAPAAAPPPEEKPEIVLRAQPPAADAVPVPEPVEEAAPSTQPASAPASTVTEPVPSERPAPAPSSPAAESAGPVQAVTPRESTEVAKPVATEGSPAPAPAGTITAPATVPAPQSAETPPPAPEKSSGSNDANAGDAVVTLAPSTESPKGGAASSAEPVSPSAEVAPPAEADLPISAAAAMAPPDEPNEERERVVRMGAFEKPREEGPDPSIPAHKTTFQPGDADGFQEGQRPECTKNITLGSLKDERLVLGTPGWAEKWIGKNQKRIPQVCFSDTPMQGARNYLIVFYTPPVTVATEGAEITNTLMAPPQGAPDGGVGSFTTSYGSTWHYSIDRTVGVTVLTRNDADQPHSQPGRVWYATAYTDEGLPVAQHWPEQPKHPVKTDTGSKKKDRAARAALEHLSEDLLDQMVEDILKL